MRRTIGSLALALLLAFAPKAASAQTKFGGLLAYHDDADFGVGAFLMLPIAALNENISFEGDFTMFFPDGYDYFEVNGNLVYQLKAASPTITPFLLAGLNVARAKAFSVSNTELGLNLGGGIQFSPDKKISPFVGAKLEVEGGDAFAIFGGLAFGSE